MNRRPHLTAAMMAFAAALLVACSTSSTPNASGAPTPSTIGGMTSCAKDQLAIAASEAAQALSNENVYTIDDLQCADGWAVTSGLLANKEDPNKGAPTSFVFRQEGQFWVVQDKAKVCGTKPTTTTTPPDATIPASVFIPGCAAG